MPLRRVVVTGVGLITPLGVGREVLDRLAAGHTGIAKIKSFDHHRFPCHLAGSITDFQPLDYVSAGNFRKMDRLSSLTTAAARMALEDAGIRVTEKNRQRIGIILGVAYGSIDVSIRLATTIFTGGPRQANPIIVPNVVMNAPAGHAAIELSLKGVNSTINHNAASAETAIAYAATQISQGRADAIITGGADVIAPFLFEVLVNFKALSGSSGGIEMARPFDQAGNGFILGESVGLLCLEPLEAAIERGARPLAEILGWGLAGQPSSITDWPEDPRGAILAIERALASADIKPDEIDLINASANGSPRLDRLEARAIDQVFGRGQELPLVTSIKGAVGESFSSGGLRTALTAVALKEALILPTLGLIDPIERFNYVTETNYSVKLGKALVTGFSAGGTFASIIVGRV